MTFYKEILLKENFKINLKRKVHYCLICVVKVLKVKFVINCKKSGYFYEKKNKHQKSFYKVKE